MRGQKKSVFLMVGTIGSALIAYFLVSFWGAYSEQLGQAPTPASAKFIFTASMTALAYLYIRHVFLSDR
jgi:hypothetical protein